LSDASGIFATPIATGSTSSNGNGSGSITVPGNATAGTGYLIRVKQGTTISTNTVSLTVSSSASLTLSSAAGTNSQTVCQNSAIPAVQYTLGGGATGATVTGLPTGVTFNSSGGSVEISGTPTVTGAFTYTVTTTGASCNTSVTGTITVSSPGSLTLSSAAGTTSQTSCVNSAIANIVYTVGGSATAASASGLPAGVSGSYNSGNKNFTLSGTPTVSGTFTYTITTTGSSCNTSVTGTLTVNSPATLTLSSVAGTNSQTVCQNSAITAIQYTLGGGATGATVTGLPTGVTFNSSGGSVEISGTPTVTGAFTYTVTTTGASCNTSVTGTITVSSPGSLTLSSAAGTTSQTVCVNSAITNIEYTVTNATGANVTGLPAGVSFSFSGGKVQISGTPTVSGTITYTVTTTGSSCNTSVTGTLTVNSPATLTLSSAAGTNSQTVCQNSAITAVQYTLGGGATGAIVTGLPTGVTFNSSGGSVEISGTPTVTGTFTYTVTTTGASCNTSVNGTITSSAGTLTLSSAAGTNNQTVCQGSAITNIQYNFWGGGRPEPL
jgi:hypothetical protein